MNLKTFSTGLALSALGVLSLATQADAYSFSFLGSAAAGGGQTNYQFGFTAAPGDTLKLVLFGALITSRSFRIGSCFNSCLRRG